MIHRLNTILQRLLPNYCLMCKEPTNSKLALCKPCIQTLPWCDKNRCLICFLALPKTQVCGKCLKDPPAFQQVLAPFDYKPPLDKFISKLKFSHKLIYAYLLGELITCHLHQIKHPLPEAIIPVPLHTKRIRERGFNQAGEIAKVISRRLALPCQHFALKRHKATKAQAQLNAKKRIENVRNAFTLCKNIPYKSIAIVDDVITTGATIRQVSSILKKNGVKRIEVWAATRARI